jgi:hypothetical protein
MEMHSERLSEYGGDWTKATSELCQVPVCIEDSSLGNLTWRTDPPYDLFTKQTACQHMHNLGYNHIFLAGDSFIRHIYQSLLLVFSDDYEYGALNAETLKCKGDNQFSEKGCSRMRHFSKPSRSVCNNTIKLDFLDIFNFRSSPDKTSYLNPQSLVIWSEGTHPALFNYTHPRGGRNVSNLTVTISIVQPIDIILYRICII